MLLAFEDPCQGIVKELFRATILWAQLVDTKVRPINNSQSTVHESEMNFETQTLANLDK